MEGSQREQGEGWEREQGEGAGHPWSNRHRVPSHEPGAPCGVSENSAYEVSAANGLEDRVGVSQGYPFLHASAESL